MQYYKPEGDFFAGDCMPFYHGGIFRLYYLLDRGHHGALGGLGGHLWAHSSTRDLVHWEHHPLAIPITEQQEGSICTGSVLFHDGRYYGFYATRMRDRTQHLSLAVSSDAVNFEKAEPNPFAFPPPGYSRYHYRDPVVFQDRRGGRCHMLVTASLLDPPVPGHGGCLAHLVSDDLQEWELRDPFMLPGLPGVPECPDYFHWNGWFYLLFSHGGVARYRMSREPLGPWLRPTVDTLDGPAARVMKTAEFSGNRRIGVAWIGTRLEDKDGGRLQWGGNALFRELVQHADGSLGARFPAEMAPRGSSISHPRLSAYGAETTIDGRRIRISARRGLGAAACSGVPQDLRLLIRVEPSPDACDYGLRLRAGEAFGSGYDLHFFAAHRIACLGEQRIVGVDGLDKPFTLEIILKGDIIDVCIDDRRTLIDRCPEQYGQQLFLYAQDSEVTFEVVEIQALS